MTDTQIIKGKVKTVFTTSEPDKVLIQYEDRVTAGNGKKIDFPQGKGRVCMEISAFLFEMLEGMGIKTEINYVPEKTSFLVNSMFSAGAVAIDDEGIVKITCEE